MLFHFMFVDTFVITSDYSYECAYSSFVAPQKEIYSLAVSSVVSGLRLRLRLRLCLCLEYSVLDFLHYESKEIEISVLLTVE